MPIDIDEIRKGRRRDWDKLQDPEVVRERKRQERENDPEYQKKKSWLKRRDDDLKKAAEADQIEFQKVKKRVIWMFAGFFALLIFTSLSNYIIAYFASQSREDKVFELTSLVNKNIAYENYETPIDAWATWRSAWMRKDGLAVAKTYSKEHLQRVQGKLSDKAYGNKLTNEIEKGHQTRNIWVAEKFENPEIVNYPIFGLRDGTLAIFKKEMERDPSAGEGMITYVLAIAYVEDDDEWRIEDLRIEGAWRDSWTHRNKIHRSRNPDQIRKDEIESEEFSFW